ncbi:MAG: hypothetical protein KDD45_06165 [Bdellovibrionales bacterium]|nr:hypothetical protein [Bdellovibrionales bacterium]
MEQINHVKKYVSKILSTSVSVRSLLTAVIVLKILSFLLYVPDTLGWQLNGDLKNKTNFKGLLLCKQRK